MFKHLVFASTIGTALLFAGCQPGSPGAGPEQVTPAGEAVDPRVAHRLQLTDGQAATEFQGQPAFGLLLAGRGQQRSLLVGRR